MLEVSNIADKEDYIRVEVLGESTPGKELDDAMNVWPRAADICREKQVYRILVDWRFPGGVPTSTGYDIGSKSTGLFGRERRLRLAVVHLDQSEKARDIYRFVENVAHNRGFQFKSFADEKEATNWLQAT